MKILVTGANGYIGTGVVKQLLDDGVDVIATDFSTSRVDKRANCINSNIFEIEKPYEYFEKPDVLLHLAWRDGFNHSSLNHINDFSGHYSFLSRMMESGLNQLCALGTMHEIGFYEGCINENTPTNPQSLYGIAKNALREAVELKAKECNVIFQWLRGYYIVGNAKNGCSIFSKIMQAEMNSEKKFPFTTGQNQYDFIDYDVFCNQIAKTAEQNEVVGIINCCSGSPMKLADRVQQFIDDNNFKIELDYGAYPDRPYDSKAVWGDDSKIKKIIG